MFSHIHEEQYQVQTDMREKKPIGMSYIIGSGTTFLGKPPSFAVFSIDPVTALPTNMETIAFNLTHANTYDEPIWTKMWDDLTEYDLPDMSP